MPSPGGILHDEEELYQMVLVFDSVRLCVVVCEVDALMLPPERTVQLTAPLGSCRLKARRRKKQKIASLRW